MTEQAAQPQMVPPWWTDPTKNVETAIAASDRRQDDLREAESGHVRELMSLRATYDEQLRQAETNRIDAIRQVDVAAVQRAAEVQAAQQQALATQVATVADAFRASLAATIAPIMTAIEDLRRAQYETQGQKQQVVETRDVRGDARLNLGAVVSVILALATVITLVLYVTKR